jgi:urate oxidase
MPTVGTNRYGKRRIRLVKVARHAGRDDLKEITAQILLEGEFESCYRLGDNRNILPTDTLKNTVYALARHSSLDPIEEFALELVRHFLNHNPQVAQVRLKLVETPWSRIMVGGQPHGAAFEQRGPEKRTTSVMGGRKKIVITSGVEHLVVLKTSHSAFEGFIHDGFTTLPEVQNRLLSTEIRAEWRYSKSPLPFNEIWCRALDTLKRAFAEHKSRSVQHTLFEIGQSVLSRIAEIEEIYLSMPNKHCLRVDLSPFGMDNPDEVFVPLDEPHGAIEARLLR